MNVPGGGGP